jgi:hypothetical protein
MTKANRKLPDEAMVLYEEMVASVPEIDRKGAAYPYTAVNGNMFSVLRPDGVVCLRLPDAKRLEFVARYKTKPVIMYGAVMKEYVAVPAPLLRKTAELRQYFAASVAYAKSLKPKATTRKRGSK